MGHIRANQRFKYTKQENHHFDFLKSNIQAVQQTLMKI